MKRSVSYCVALGGTFASMCLLSQFITGVFPMFYIVMPMLCGILVTIMKEETSTRWGFLMYLAVGTLSLFVTPNKDAAFIFILFFGHYPLIRPMLDRLRLPLFIHAARILVYNVCMVLYFLLTVYVFGMDELLEEMGEYGKYGIYIVLGTANVMFLSYDYLLDIAMQIYRKQLHRKISG